MKKIGNGGTPGWLETRSSGACGGAVSVARVSSFGLSGLRVLGFRACLLVAWNEL